MTTLGVGTILTLIFIILKLTGTIVWPWFAIIAFFIGWHIGHLLLKAILIAIIKKHGTDAEKIALKRKRY